MRTRVFVVTISHAMLLLAVAPLRSEDGNATYAPTVKRIIEQTMRENDSWKKMEELCDGIGHRLSGSPELERAIEWAIATMKADGHENVRGEKVMVPKWVRGEESAEIVSPRRIPMAMLGLGGSIRTPKEGITARVVVVRDEAELEAAGDKVKGAIVLYNNAMPPYDDEHGSRYGETVRFRGKGAILAAKQGAVACLVRSVTARSLRSPHTGMMRYEEGVKKIPAAAVSCEDAEMIARLTARGQEVKVTLKMSARDEGMAPSANVIGELRGRERPDEVVVIGGHFDSWDVGQGAHDDATGCVMAMEAISVLRRMGLTPRRTIRVVLWTNEENGLMGGKAYAQDHADEMDKHIVAIESDAGGFRPESFGLECADKARREKAAKQMDEILALLAPVGTLRISGEHSGADISPMKESGVMLMGLGVEGSKYFDYHHSHADTLDKVDPRELSQCVAVMAAVSYVIADMPERFGGEPAHE